MIRSLSPAALEEHPELGRVEVSVVGCDECFCEGAISLRGLCALADPCHCHPDPRLILFCTEAAEVGEMMRLDFTCPSGHLFSGQPVDFERACPHCHRLVMPITARLFLWRGEKVDDWEALLCTPCPACAPDDTYPTLTAVVLVGKSGQYICKVCSLPGVECTLPFPHGPVRRPEIDEAARACDEAEVQFVIPGDPKRGQLEITP